MQFDGMFSFEIVEQVDIVSDQKDRGSRFVRLDKDIRYDLGILPVEVSCWFVGDDEFRIVNKRSGEWDSLFFSGAQ